MLNSVKPQSRQITSVGKAITPGLSRLEKWMLISELNCRWLLEPHDLHDMAHPVLAS